MRTMFLRMLRHLRQDSVLILIFQSMAMAFGSDVAKDTQADDLHPTTIAGYDGCNRPNHITMTQGILFINLAYQPPETLFHHTDRSDV